MMPCLLGHGMKRAGAMGALLLLLLVSAACIDAQLHPHALNFDGFWAAGVALDGAGSVYASSYYGDVVYRFNASTGRLLDTLDTSYSFVAPTGLAWDPVYGGLLVADTVRYGWARLSPDSSVLPFFPLAPSLPPPTPSNAPGGVAVDPVSGSIYLGQYYGALLQAYAANGSLLWESSVYADGSAANVRGMAVDAQRVLWIAEYHLGNIVQFSASGERGAVLSSAWLDNPWGVAVDAAGDLYVSAYGFNSVVKFNVSSGQLNRLQSFTTSNPQLDAPAGLAVDGDGYVYTGDLGNGRLVKFAPDGSVAAVLTVGDSWLLSPVSLAYDATRGSLVVASNGAQALFLVSPNGSVVSDIALNEPLSLSFPGGAAVDSFGDVLLVNTDDNQLLKIQLGADAAWNSLSIPQVQFAAGTNPGIAVDAANNYYMSDSTINQTRVLKMLDTGSLQTVFVTSSPALRAPAGVAVTPDGSLLYCADQGNNRVVQWSTASSQSAPSQVWSGSSHNFSNPVGLVVDPAGNVFVSADGSVYQLHPNGSVTVACGLAPPPANQSIGDDYYTSFLTVDNSGNLYLADYLNYRILVCPAAAPAAIASSTAAPFLGSSALTVASSSSSVASTASSVVSASSSAASSSSAPVVAASSSQHAASSQPVSPSASSSSAAVPSSSAPVVSSSSLIASSSPLPTSPLLAATSSSSSAGLSIASSASSLPASSSSTVTATATIGISSGSSYPPTILSSSTGQSSQSVPAPSSAFSSTNSAGITSVSSSSSSSSSSLPPAPAQSFSSLSSSSSSFSSSSSSSSPLAGAISAPGSSSGGLSGGAIAGIAVGAAVFALCLLLLGLCIAARRRRDKEPKAEAAALEAGTYNRKEPISALPVSAATAATPSLVPSEASTTASEQLPSLSGGSSAGSLGGPGGTGGSMEIIPRSRLVYIH